MNYNWTLKDAKFTKDMGTVFSCFSGGGGSSMGYKLAGFDVLGCNDIDSKMMEVYKANHNPKYAYLEPIQTFKLRKDLPKELYNLDILDGSPPCSNFSMIGSREKDWGKEKKFREGQAKQVLDNLFFDFIDLAKELQPKVIVAENVKGLIQGNAIKYVRKIYREFDLAGYYCQHWLLDASKMGVPQKRERVFFICARKDINIKQSNTLFYTYPLLDMSFNSPEIPFKEISENDFEIKGDFYKNWKKIKPGQSWIEIEKKYFNTKKVHPDKPIFTITSQYRPGFHNGLLHHKESRKLNKNEYIKCHSFPLDFDFLSKNMNDIIYIIGMSVPPVMIAQIANRIYEQWLKITRP